MSAAPDPISLVRSPQYLRALVLAALIGAPIAALAYGFLALVDELQGRIFTDLPDALGLSPDTWWWPIAPLVTAGIVVGLCIRYLPGHGGESPAEGFRAGGGPAPPTALPGIAVAAFAGLAAGAVLGPEAPLIALGGGLSAAILHLRRRDADGQATALLGATGSFAAVSTLLGNPLVGAVLMLEAAGLGGGMTSLVLVPGLLASGVGFLVFVGLDSLTGLGTFSLVLPDIAPVGTAQLSWFAWAIVVGVAAAPAVWCIRLAAQALKPHVERRLLVMTPLAGLAVALVAILYNAQSDKPVGDVLFSGQAALGPLVGNAGTYSVETLLLLAACKAAAYAICLSAFRGGPVFPAMFLGAAGGIALSHLPGLPVTVGVGIGVGAMLGAMLRLPVFAVLLTGVFLMDAGPDLLAPVIVAVVAAYVASAWFLPDGPAGDPGSATDGGGTRGPARADARA